MSKRNKIIYWISTLWLALGMTSTGIVQLFQMKEEVAFILKMGYPGFFLQILGFSKLLGVVAVLIPRFPLVKEWAYAGFFFTMTGALYSHIAAGNSASEMSPPLLLLVLTIVSWYFRPVDRKVLAISL
jgi:DoxX-like family